MARSAAGFETLTQQVYEKLRNRIIEGQLPPGSRLVRRQLSKNLGVSTIPVMEALIRLEHDGLVESRAMFGSRVVVFDDQRLAEEIILREAIETQCARLMVRIASDEALSKLVAQAKSLDQTYKTCKDVATLSKAHFDFHLKIAELSGCKLLLEEMQRIGFRYLMRIDASQDIERGLPEPWHEHEQLAEVFLKRNDQQADAALRNHVRQMAPKVER